MADPASTATGKNIVLCFDGTGDWAGDDTTNVMKIYDRLDNVAQCTFYSGGVGTLGSPLALNPVQRTFLKLLDLASATSIRDKVLEGYQFLIDNYEPAENGRPESKIFMFGFSRGAFTARLLASLVHNFGLLTKEHRNLDSYLWQTISDFKSFDDFLRDAATIKRCFSDGRDVKIYFLGLFDTVSSVGIFERFKVYPYTNKNPSVLNVRHAVSIDEQRNAFPELLVDRDRNNVNEVWFPGVHRDVGGGASDHPGYSNVTLNWMIAETPKELLLDRAFADESDKQVHGSFFDPYVFVGLYPMKMFDNTLKGKPVLDPGFRWFWPNFRHVRAIPDGAKVKRGGDIATEHTSRSLTQRLATRIFDIAVTLLGVCLAVLVLMRGLETAVATHVLNGSDLTDWLAWPRIEHWHIRSWPPGFYPAGSIALSSTWAFWIFGLFTLHQGIYQWLEQRGKSARRPGWGRWINLFLQLTLIVLALVVAKTYSPWLALMIGFGFACTVTVAAHMPVGPFLRADRTIGYFMAPWFLIIAGYFLLDRFLNWIVPYIRVIGGFLLGGRVIYFSHEPALTYLAVTAALGTAILGIANIMKDRSYQARPERNPNKQFRWQLEDGFILLRKVINLNVSNLARSIGQVICALLVGSITYSLVFVLDIRNMQQLSWPQWSTLTSIADLVIACSAAQVLFAGINAYSAGFGIARTLRPYGKAENERPTPTTDPTSNNRLFDSVFGASTADAVDRALKMKLALDRRRISGMIGLCGALFLAALSLHFVWTLFVVAFLATIIVACIPVAGGYEDSVNLRRLVMTTDMYVRPDTPPDIELGDKKPQIGAPKPVHTS